MRGDGTTFRSHLLHLSIDFSGRKGGTGSDGVEGRWTSPPPSSTCTFLKEPSPRPRPRPRTGIKFNCLPVAFGRVRNREERRQLFRSFGGRLVVPSTSRRVSTRRSREGEEGEEEGERGGGLEMQIRERRERERVGTK